MVSSLDVNKTHHRYLILTTHDFFKDLPIPQLSNLDNISIKRVNPLMASTNKPKQQSYDDDPWRIASTPPNNNVFPVYQNTGDKYEEPTTNIKSTITDNTVKKPAMQAKGGVTEISTPDTANVSEATSVVVEPVIADKVSTQALVKASTESYQWFLDLDQITVTVAEKEGFLFTHVNYWVQSSQRQTSVRRRYSDFYWFWEILLKRYPFRVIPNLPPKKLSGSKCA